MRRPRLLVHGGAGAIRRPGLDEAGARRALAAALEAGWALLCQGGAALDAAEAAVASLEASGHFNAGKGAVRASDGLVTLDAAVMEGRSREAGAVAVLSGYPGAIAIARRILERRRHLLLAGAGAEAFAAREGFARVDPAYFVRPPGADPSAPSPGAPSDPSAPSPGTTSGGHGTVGAVALDVGGALAAATSTGGTVGKEPGRIGDSPLVGAGTYADERCAVSATGQGERFIRAVFAFRAAVLVESGLGIEQAARRALDEVARLGGEGGCVALAGDGAWTMPFSTEGMFRGVVDEAGPRVAIFAEPLAPPG